MRSVGGVRKSIDQSWLAKGLGLGLLCWGFKGVQEERFLGKRPALFKSGQWHFHQDNAPVHNFILVTDYLTKMGIKTVPHCPYGLVFAPCYSSLFPKLGGCRYERIEEMKGLWRKSLTHSYKRTSMGPSRICWNGTSGLQPGTIVSCVLSIKVHIRKKIWILI